MFINIRVYLYNESIKYFKEKNTLIENISKDCHVIIRFIFDYGEPYLSIDGLIEDVHKARIILQDIEKTNYKDSYYINTKTFK